MPVNQKRLRGTALVCNCAEDGEFFYSFTQKDLNGLVDGFRAFAYEGKSKSSETN